MRFVRDDKSEMLVIYGSEDQGVPASGAEPLRKKLAALGKKVETVVYPGTNHAFLIGCAIYQRQSLRVDIYL